MEWLMVQFLAMNSSLLDEKKIARWPLTSFVPKQKKKKKKKGHEQPSNV